MSAESAFVVSFSYIMIALLVAIVGPFIRGKDGKKLLTNGQATIVGATWILYTPLLVTFLMKSYPKLVRRLSRQTKEYWND